jgi:F-type H+-transporting ATPase subunit b
MSLFVLLIAAEAWAVTAGGEHHAPSIHGIWFPLINFLIFAYIIKRFALPLVRDFFQSRRREVLTTVTAAAEAKRRAEAVVQDYKTRLARVDQEAQTIQSTLRSEGERERQKLLAEAENTAVKIKEDAQFLADQEVKIARQRMRAEIARAAEARATELVQSHISAPDHERLAQEFIHQIGPVT